jgi:hypothetical protein
MSRIEELATKYRHYIAAPWQRNLAGPQKTIFIVHPKADERRLRARLELFETDTRESGHPWKQFDFTRIFARWMAAAEYREVYFEEPENLAMKLQRDFLNYAAQELRTALTESGVDENTVVAVLGVACLYGFSRVSLVVKQVENDIRGRLVVFFPGVFENNNYRLLDARDGWNYMAVPITLDYGGN